MNTLVLILGCLSAYSYNVVCTDDFTADFIVVGAGAAGCVVASRLSEDGKYTVLLLEAGGEPETYYDIPFYAPGPYRGTLDWNVVPETEEKACRAFINDTCFFPLGKGLGGTTAINTMIHSRGNKNDYNHWRDLGNEGWGYEDVLTYFKKSENFNGPVTATTKNYHGFDGPFTITPAPYYPELTDSILEAGRELGYAVVDQDAASQKGFSEGYFNLRNGRRLSAYRAYLENERSNRSNLQILTHAFVSKIVFDDNKNAVGVAFEHDGAQKTAKAKKEVIISAGAIHSPQILQLSGIGPKELLDKYKIPIVFESKGVGSNLQDHVIISGLAITLAEHIGFRFDKDVTAENYEKLALYGQGPLTVPLRTLGVGYIDSKYNNVSADWPDLELYIFQIPIRPPYKKEYAVTDDQVSCQNNIVVLPYLLRPKSVGSVMVKSSNPHDQPSINLNLLSEEEDVKKAVNAIEIFMKLPFTKALLKHGAYLSKLPALKTCGIYLIYLPKYFECLVKLFATPGLHVSGTCKMGPKNDPMSVVDAQLRVRGVNNLRVIDGAICPQIVSGHTMAPIIMIGEKGADMVKQRWDNK